MIVAALGAFTAPAVAQMPEPYVSPTFDAVLMPVTKQVVKQFKLPRTASGAVIVSVEPGGVADLYGLEPGEVISTFGTKKFRRPADLDAMALKSLQSGPQYLYFQGLRKGKEKRTIIYMDEPSYRRPVSLDNIRNWRSYNAPSFNFLRWYEPYSYQIVDIWDYSIYYVDQVIVSDVFISSYTSESTYFYYDYTEISSLEVRESWVEEETVLYCGDVQGYDCGVEEVGYPVEQEFETCSGQPGDDWCLPPDEVDANYCSSFPSDPACSGDGFAEDDYCTYNPDDPACGGGDAGGDTVGEDWTEYCAQNPEATECGGVAEAEDVTDTDVVTEDVAADDPSVEEYSAEEYVPEEEAPAEEYTAEDYVPEEEYPAEEYPAEEYVPEEPVYEEPAYEEPAYEEPVYEEPAYEEPVYEEPAYEEPVYEEPAYEEPVYEEPAYDGGGGGGECYYDDEGNYIC